MPPVSRRRRSWRNPALSSGMWLRSSSLRINRLRGTRGRSRASTEIDCRIRFGSTRLAPKRSFGPLSGDRRVGGHHVAVAGVRNAKSAMKRHLRPGWRDSCRSRVFQSLLRLRRWWANPSTSCSGPISNASQIRSSVNNVIGRPASIICQWRTLKPQEIMSSWVSLRSTR